MSRLQGKLRCTLAIQKALIAFPMPEMTCGYWGKAKVPEDFFVSVDGKKVNYRKEVKAFKDGQDVTERIKKAGLPVDCRELDNNMGLERRSALCCGGGLVCDWLEESRGIPEGLIQFIQNLREFLYPLPRP